MLQTNEIMVLKDELQCDDVPLFFTKKQAFS